MAHLVTDVGHGVGNEVRGLEDSVCLVLLEFQLGALVVGAHVDARDASGCDAKAHLPVDHLWSYSRLRFNAGVRVARSRSYGEADVDN